VADQAAKVLAERAGLSEQAIDANSVTGPDGLPGPVSVTVPAGTYSVIEAIRVLEAARLRLDDIHVRRATLDEVFTALTTRSAEAAAHPAEIPRQAGSPQRTEVAPALPTEGR